MSKNIFANLTGARFDVCLHERDGAVINLRDVSKTVVVDCVEANRAVKITARDRRTGKQTTFTLA
jgi:hypothetical protein